VKYGLDPQEEILKKRETIFFGEKWGEDAEEDWGTLRLADGDSFKEEKVKTERGDYRKYYENVRDAVLNGTAPTITPQSAVDVMRMLELAESSSRSKRTVLWTDKTGSP
jgi:predicted dehydrogenase